MSDNTPDNLRNRNRTSREHFRMNVDASIEQAEVWAAKLWRDSVNRWSNRTGQDISYREHVIHPALNAILHERFHGWGFRLLEVGCGDGFFLGHGVGCAITGEGGAYLGIDLSGELIDHARKRCPDPNIGFMRLDISAEYAAEAVRETGTWDCMQSVFAVQEIPDLPGMLANLRSIATPGMFVVIVTVHPDFGQWLLDNGHMSRALLAGDNGSGLALHPDSVSWRWAGTYPIVDEPREPFHLPYFHRTIDDYRAYLARAGFRVDSIRELPDPAHQIPQLVERHISPFYNFDTNVYWPRIAEGPSSIAIIAHAEDDV